MAEVETKDKIAPVMKEKAADKNRKLVGKLLEELSEQDIVDLIILHKLTDEVYKISRLLRQHLG